MSQQDTTAKVSVIVPAYNSADYTVETVESILAQTYRDFELIVVDDGSTDNTREAMASFGEAITYIYKENGGACSARNLGISRSSGEFVACIDCDDLWVLDKLERSLERLEAEPELALVFTACYLIDKDGEITGKTNYKFKLSRPYVELLHENFITAPSVVMRRACLDQVGAFDERIFIPADWDLWLRLARSFPIAYIDAPLSKYRMVSNYTLRHAQQYVEETQYLLDKHFALSADLTPIERNHILSKIYVDHSTLYRENGDMRSARAKLRAAIKLNSTSWPAYGHLVLSLLGRAIWSFADRLKDRLWGSWLVKLDGKSLQSSQSEIASQ